jgi:hypothetical protein
MRTSSKKIRALVSDLYIYGAGNEYEMLVLCPFL